MAPTQSESECVCGALGAIGEGRMPREADSGRRTGATNRVARVRRTLPRRAEPPRDGQPPPLSVRGDGPERARAMPRASRGPPEVLLPTGRMSFLTTRRRRARHRCESRCDHCGPEGCGPDARHRQLPPPDHLSATIANSLLVNDAALDALRRAADLFKSCEMPSAFGQALPPPRPPPPRVAPGTG